MNKYDRCVLTKSQFFTFFLITIIYSLKDPVQGVYYLVKKTNTHLRACGVKAAACRWGSFLWAELTRDDVRKRMTRDLEHEENRDVTREGIFTRGKVHVQVWREK